MKLISLVYFFVLSFFFLLQPSFAKCIVAKEGTKFTFNDGSSFEVQKPIISMFSDRYILSSTIKQKNKVISGNFSYLFTPLLVDEYEFNVVKNGIESQISQYEFKPKFPNNEEIRNKIGLCKLSAGQRINFKQKRIVNTIYPNTGKSKRVESNIRIQFLKGATVNVVVNGKRYLTSVMIRSVTESDPNTGATSTKKITYYISQDYGVYLKRKISKNGKVVSEKKAVKIEL